MVNVTMDKLKILFAVALLFTTSFASVHVHMKYPVKSELMEGKVTEIGQAAPGQEVTLIFGRELDSGSFKWSAVDSHLDGSKDYMIPKDMELKDILPSKTIKENGLGNETYLALRLRVPKETGEFKFNVTMSSGVWSVPATRRLSIDVRKDVYDFEIPEISYLTAGEVGEVEGKIKSNSIAVENFTFKPSKLPKEWLIGESGKKNTQVKVKPGEEKSFKLPMQINQEGLYEAIYDVSDTAGTHVGQYDANIRAKPTLRSKLKGFNKGHSLTLPILQPFYSLLSMFG